MFYLRWLTDRAMHAGIQLDYNLVASIVSAKKTSDVRGHWPMKLPISPSL